jgi:hypothetical protein
LNEITNMKNIIYLEFAELLGNICFYIFYIFLIVFMSNLISKIVYIIKCQKLKKWH